ncbi:bifunctional pyr operon transcriptional regulator/uracil phosphoribosyltransferase PyrR [Vallitaleaceae bacterium 9-2]
MKILMDNQAMRRAITRISHEIIEKNKGTHDLVIIGVKTRGIPLASRIVERIEEIEGVKLPMGTIDITFYRDDLQKKSERPVIHQLDQIDVKDKTVIIADDVVFTGRTCRAAIDAIIDQGRPNKIQFAALIDRGHRELPLRPDFVGKNVPTSTSEIVHVNFEEIDGEDRVVLQ